jgi:hypothetical protein
MSFTRRVGYHRGEILTPLSSSLKLRVDSPPGAGIVGYKVTYHLTAGFADPWSDRKKKSRINVSRLQLTCDAKTRMRVNFYRLGTARPVRFTRTRKKLPNLSLRHIRPTMIQLLLLRRVGIYVK